MKQHTRTVSFLVLIAMTIVLALTGCSIVNPNNNPDNSSKLPTGTGGETTIHIKQVTVTDDGTGDPDTRALTRQEICEQVMPSVVYLVNIRSGVSTGAGSGIIMADDGTILTNAHVAENCDLMAVTFYDGTTTEAKLVGIDVFSDLAVIQISDPNFDLTKLRPATFGVSEDLKLGDPLVVLGNPGGEQFSFSATFGYVSAMHRAIETSNGYTINCIQTDAAINPGNSGGALVNEYGLVVGINSSKIAATEYEGLGFAIEIDEAVKIIPDLIKYGYVQGRPSLGINVTFGQFYDESGSYRVLRTGVQVTAIQSKAQNELKVYDVITKIDGQDITSLNTFTNAVKNKSVGDKVTLEVYRQVKTGNSFWGTSYKYVLQSSSMTAVVGDYAELYS